MCRVEAEEQGRARARARVGSLCSDDVLRRARRSRRRREGWGLRGHRRRGRGRCRQRGRIRSVQGRLSATRRTQGAFGDTTRRAEEGRGAVSGGRFAVRARAAAWGAGFSARLRGVRRGMIRGTGDALGAFYSKLDCPLLCQLLRRRRYAEAARLLVTPGLRRKVGKRVRVVE